MKFILEFSMFLTLFLALYFISNFKPHPVTIVQNRIKTLRSNLFEQLYIKKTGQDRAKWILELEQRRDEIRFELKSRIGVKRNMENKIDDIIDKAWDELLAVMKSGCDMASLEEIVKTRIVKIKTAVETSLETAVETLVKTGVETADYQDDIRDYFRDTLDEISGEFEEVEAIDETEELEKIDEIQETNEIEEAIEDEKIDEFEELEEAEEIEEIKSYAEIQLSKSLLKAANEILVKIKKEEAKVSALVRTRKGLLKLANEFLKSKETVSAPARTRKGLFKLANEFLESKETAEAENTTLLHQ
jgi:Mg2+ and Co2+ transporter CorA